MARTTIESGLDAGLGREGAPSPDPTPRQLALLPATGELGFAEITAGGAAGGLPPPPQQDSEAQPPASIEGTFGDDLIVGSDWVDHITAWLGDDVVFAQGGDDLIVAGMALGGLFDDADWVFGGDGNDVASPTTTPITSTAAPATTGPSAATATTRSMATAATTR